MTCHLHILVMAGELPQCVDNYTLIAWAHFYETGTGLAIIEPYYEEPCMSNTTPWTQSNFVCATMWSWRRTGAIRSNRLESVIIQTAMFCFLCKRLSWHCAIPCKMVFLASKRELPYMHVSCICEPACSEKVCHSYCINYTGPHWKIEK